MSDRRLKMILNYAGAYFPENINKIEEQNLSFDSLGGSLHSHEIYVPCNGPGRSEISTLMNSGQGEDEAITCNISTCLSQEKNDMLRNSEILEDGKDVKIYHQRKRLKKTDHSDFLRSDVEPLDEGADLSLGDLCQIKDSCLDKPVECEYVSHCISSNMHEKDTFENGISAEVDGKSQEKPIHCSVEFPETYLNEYDSTLIRKSDDTSGDAGMHAHMLPESRAGNGKAFNVVSMEISSDSSYSTTKRKCVDADMVVSDQPEEQHDWAKVADGDALGSTTPLYRVEQQCVVTHADLSLKLVDGTEGVSSLVVRESMNAHVGRAFAGFKHKKLLVLDLNGLLLDISSYVPYDCEADAIIMKKAVFRRPHCDDFLNFCFERFNVGFWTSRTKRNMEPILDFLLGNSKSRLFFYWDQSHCTNTGFYTVEKRDKPLLLKKLKKLWDKRDPGLPWERGVYNESNTLLVDDTPSKALSNPRHTAVFPYSYRFRDVRDNSLGPGGDLRVYLEGLAEAENVQEYVKQNPFGQRPITEKNLSWGYYRKVIEATSTPPRETDTNNP